MSFNFKHFWQNTVKQKVDIYGSPINVNFKGQESFNTSLGTVLTIVTAICCIVYTSQKFGDLTYRENPNVTFNSGIISDIDKQLGLQTSPDMNFAMGFYISSKESKSKKTEYFTPDPRLLNIKVTQYQKNLDTLEETSTIDLPFGDCFKDEENNLFDENARKILKKKPLGNQCIDTRNLIFAGNENSGVIKFPRITIEPCKDGITNSGLKKGQRCYSDRVIKQKLNELNLHFRVFYAETYIDFSDYKNSVRQSIKYTTSAEINPNFTQDISNIFKIGTSDLIDHQVQVFGEYPTQRKYMNFDAQEVEGPFQYKGDLGVLPLNFLQFDSVWGINSQIHTRQVYSMLDFLGDIGGLQGAMVIICQFLTGIFSTSMFTNDLVTSIFPVHKTSARQALKKMYNLEFTKLDEMKKPGQKKNLLQEDVIHLLKQTFSQQRRLNISFCQAFAKISWLTYPDVLWKKCCFTRTSYRMREQLLEKGNDRIQETLDVKNIVRQTNLVKNFMKLILDKSELTMLQLQRNNMLELSDNNKEIPSDEIVDLSKLNTKQLKPFQDETTGSESDVLVAPYIRAQQILFTKRLLATSIDSEFKQKLIKGLCN